MFRSLRLRLWLSNLGVFLTLLGVFGVAVYVYFVHSLYAEMNNQLHTLAIASVDIEGHKPNLTDPDFMADQDFSFGNVQFQWFTHLGKLESKQGDLVVNLPLRRREGYQTQLHPHAQIFTLPVENHGQLLGYLRVGYALSAIDEDTKRLSLGLGLGAVSASVLMTLGVLWLTRQAMEPIEQSFRQLRQFTADAAHELRSPLMAIQTNSAVALRYREGIRPKDQEKFTHIYEATQQLNRLTEDLLLLARRDATQPRPFQTLDLSVLLAKLLDQLPTAQHQIRIELPPGLNLSGHPEHLERLFRNLLENALRYTPGDGEIEISAQRLPQQVQVRIRDSGIGIAAAELPYIFDRFWRADRARSYHGGGNGLGLAIVQSLVQEHQGQISVTSQLDQGTCFTVTLPAVPKGSKM